VTAFGLRQGTLSLGEIPLPTGDYLGVHLRVIARQAQRTLLDVLPVPSDATYLCSDLVQRHTLGVHCLLPAGPILLPSVAYRGRTLMDLKSMTVDEHRRAVEVVVTRIEATTDALLAEKQRVPRDPDRVRAAAAAREAAYMDMKRLSPRWTEITGEVLDG
jgi:hypothetical protein